MPPGATKLQKTPGRLPSACPAGPPVRAPRLRPVACSAVERVKVADQLTLQGRCLGEDLVQRLGDRTGHCAGADATDDRADPEGQQAQEPQPAGAREDRKSVV